MRQDPRPAPLVARLIRWSMFMARQGRPVSPGVFQLLMVLGERYNHERGFAFPGTSTLVRDLGISPRGLRKRLRAAEQLGAIEVKIGCGHGVATQIRFAAEVWTAPNLPTLAQMDRCGRPQRGNGSSAFSITRPQKGGTGGLETGNSDALICGTAVPPYRCSSTAAEPLRPAAAPPSPVETRTTDNDNGTSKKRGGGGQSSEGAAGAFVRPPPLHDERIPRVEEFRQRLASTGTYRPPPEDVEAERRRFLAEQARALLAEGQP